MKKHNFYAGPSILSQFTIENTAKAILDFDGIGLSILEISHRSKEFEKVISDSVSLFKELLNIPDGYSVLFLGGGASMQFCMVPFNLLNKKAGYVLTGTWAKKAYKEAKLVGEAVALASSESENFCYIPKGYEIPTDIDYLHVTTNNTIFGTQMKTDLSVSVPVVADMSSDIFARPVDVSKYGLIYGGAQKNLGPSGVAFVIVKNDLLGKVQRTIPTMLDYKIHIENDSLYNTPPVVNIYACLQTLKWYKAQGGIEAMYKKNIEKANILYSEIDRNRLFKSNVKNEEDRSIMNVCFIMNDEYKDLEPKFNEFASARGMIGIKGHRSVGGFRASIYNAMDKSSVIALTDAMKEFEKTV